LAVAPAAGKLSFHADPLGSDAQPSGATIDGNVYRLRAAVVGAPAGAAITAKTAAQGGTNGSNVTLRATSARQPHPDFYYRETPSSPWHGLSTIRVGNDVYRADFVGFGDYALAWAAGGGSSRGSMTSSALLVAVPVLLLTGVVVAVRRSRRKGSRPERPPA
jgi:hypothetical protein